MFEALVQHTVKSNVNARIKKSLEELARLDVFVGIPQNDAERPPGDSGSNSRGAEPITNAQLLYIQEHGVRSLEMRSAMQGDLDSGVPYSRAHQLFIHEHGSPLWQIPPRPVLGPAIASVRPKIALAFKLAVQAALAGDNLAARKHVETAGQIGATAAFNWFTDPRSNWPPNADSTVRAKGSDRPLIDTGEMRKAITYVVRER